MDVSPDTILLLWDKLVWPLIRLLFFISIGLFAANLIESLNWTRKVSALSRPLIKTGNLPDRAGAAFSMALISGVAANTMLAESYNDGLLNKKELILANLFNSLPTYFLHLPTVIVITLPLIKSAAFIYVGITFGAALLRTFTIVLIGRVILEKPDVPVSLPNPEKKTSEKSELLTKTWKRFKRRMKKIVIFTIPIYVIIFIMNRLDFFNYIEEIMAGYLHFVPWLSPQALGIITLHLAAELTAGLAAAGALLQEGVLSHRDIILALLIGNVISSPVRAIRHQFPYYAGIFKPHLATELIFYNQCFRIFSLIFVGSIYFIISAG
jgi:hypothetical protein